MEGSDTRRVGCPVWRSGTAGVLSVCTGVHERGTYIEEEGHVSRSLEG